ncbi:MAG TPA: hypothetical protein VFR28_10335 [Allosphingosinicella sp.]|nr:hypothetical protein [Allosphingosinicella sp.]
MIAGRSAAWSLAACAALVAAAPSAAKKPPTLPSPPVTDERLYQNAMECKVRIEALVTVARNAAERRRFEQALALWTAQEQAIGAKLGKSEGAIAGDEILFGTQEGARPGSLQRAAICVEHSAAASWQR